MDKYFYVDSIINNMCRLEDIDTKKILYVYNYILPVKEGDYLHLVDGKFLIDKEFKDKRKEELMKKFLEVSND